MITSADLRRARKKSGAPSQAAFARKLGIAQPVYWRWEAQRVPTSKFTQAFLVAALAALDAQERKVAQ